MNVLISTTNILRYIMSTVVQNYTEKKSQVCSCQFVTSCSTSRRQQMTDTSSSIACIKVTITVARSNNCRRTATQPHSLLATRTTQIACLAGLYSCTVQIPKDISSLLPSILLRVCSTRSAAKVTNQCILLPV